MAGQFCTTHVTTCVIVKLEKLAEFRPGEVEVRQHVVHLGGIFVDFAPRQFPDVAVWEVTIEWTIRGVHRWSEWPGWPAKQQISQLLQLQAGIFQLPQQKQCNWIWSVIPYFPMFLSQERISWGRGRLFQISCARGALIWEGTKSRKYTIH